MQSIFGPISVLVFVLKGGFELGGREVSEAGVFSMGVVVAIDVFEDLKASVAGILETAFLKHLGLESADERFGPGVVVRVGSSGHALEHAGIGQGSTKGAAAILTATVAVEDGLACRLCSEGLPEGGEHKVGAQVIAQAPSHNASGAKVDHNGQIQPS